MSNSNRFGNYREMLSRFNSTGECGHPIKKGDCIGWHRTYGALCNLCWLKWRAENAAAEFDERQYQSQY